MGGGKPFVSGMPLRRRLFFIMHGGRVPGGEVTC